MKSLTVLSLISVLVCGVEGKNDWSKPCLSGACSFDIARFNSSMAATLSINGSSSAISDITEAAGWKILNCSTSTNTQTIQLICTDESKGCDHLFQEGAENTVVRLPEDCGAGPFVRVVTHSVSANQSLSTNVASIVTRSNGTSPQVHLLQIDTSFTDAGSSGRKVDFSLVASTNPDFALPNSAQASGAQSGSAPFTFDDDFTLFIGTMLCPTSATGNEAAEMTTTVSFDANVDYTIGYTFTVSGSVMPQAVDTFVATTDMEGTFDAMAISNAQLIGSPDINEVTLVNTALPELSVAGFVSIAPQFSIEVGSSGNTYGFPSDSSVEIHYRLDDFTSTVGTSLTSNAGLVPLDSHVQLSANPNVVSSSFYGLSIFQTLTYAITTFGETGDLNFRLGMGQQTQLFVVEEEPANEFRVEISVGLGASTDATVNLPGTFQTDLDILPDADATLNIFDAFFTAGGVEEDIALSSRNSTAARRAKRQQARATKRGPKLVRRGLSCPSPTISDLSMSVTTDVSAEEQTA